MKRLLMITSALGLCLAAPGFAQTPADQNQLNRQQAAPPSTPSTPSTSAPTQSQAQTQQPPAPANTAEAPKQNQKSQAKAKKPAGAASSSSTAQAPAAGKKGRAQQSTSGSAATSTQATGSQSGMSSQSGASSQLKGSASQSSTSAATSGSTRSSASLSVNINEQQRTRIVSSLSSSSIRPVSVNFRIATGVVVPRTVVLHPLPASIVEIVPDCRGCRFFRTREEIVIVEPARKTVVAVLPAGGAAHAQSPAASKVSFTDQQREVIPKRASTLRSTATVGSSASRLVVEQEVPATIELEEFPAEIVTEVPTVRSFRYFRQDNDVVVVDPTQRRVIEVIR